MSRRILLFYITEISGHHSATLAVEKALKQIDNSVDVLNLNGFNFTSPIMEKIVNKVYISVIKKTPGVWAYLYDNPIIASKTQRIKEAIHRANYPKLQSLFEKFKPDVIACSQAFPCGMVADYKRAFNLKTPLVGILTDYLPHAYWIYNEVDYFIVASEEAKIRFSKEGISEDAIKFLGIPTDPKFTRFHEKNQLAKKFGINLDIPAILIMGGGQGLGPIKKIVKELNSLPIEFQIIVVAGTNKSLLKWLKEKQATFSKKVIVCGFIDDIDEIMELCKLVITKPGGLTTAEALAKGLPMVIIHPIPGQEMNNTEYLLKKGAAIKVENAKELKDAVAVLLMDNQRLFKMSLTAKEISRPEASINIANLLLSINV